MPASRTGKTKSNPFRIQEDKSSKINDKCRQEEKGLIFGGDGGSCEAERVYGFLVLKLDQNQVCKYVIEGLILSSSEMTLGVLSSMTQTLSVQAWNGVPLRLHLFETKIVVQNDQRTEKRTCSVIRRSHRRFRAQVGFRSICDVPCHLKA